MPKRKSSKRGGCGNPYSSVMGGARPSKAKAAKLKNLEKAWGAKKGSNLSGIRSKLNSILMGDVSPPMRFRNPVKTVKRRPGSSSVRLKKSYKQLLEERMPPPSAPHPPSKKAKKGRPSNGSNCNSNEVKLRRRCYVPHTISRIKKVRQKYVANLPGGLKKNLTSSQANRLDDEGISIHPYQNLARSGYHKTSVKKYC